LILLAKKPIRHDSTEWWVYLLDSSRLPDSGTRTLVFFAAERGERRAFSWDSDVLGLDEIDDALLIVRLEAATPF
jgi:hypothetical protein